MLHLRDKTLNEIGRGHGKTVAQVILRWHIQEGAIVIPEVILSILKENIEIFDFELTDDEIAKIRGLNIEERIFNPPF